VTPSLNSADHRVALWNALLDADMNVCYWSWISDRCTKWDQWLKFTVALTASGTVAAWSIWSQHPTGWKVLSAFACVASIGHPIFFPSERLKRISALVATWKEVCMNYELLWEQDSDLGTSDSWKRFEATKRREANIDETTLPKDDKLIQKAYDYIRRKRGLNGRQTSASRAETPAHSRET
jgi:hypothetical protein